MLPIQPLSATLFAFLCMLALVGAVLVVSVRNLFRAALCLGIVFIAIVGLFILLHAEFLAFVHLLIYVGAILTLIVFAIMLTGSSHIAMPEYSWRYRWSMGILCFGLFMGLTALFSRVAWPDWGAQAVTTAEIGQQLILTFVLPFEVISLVIIAALVGAVVLAVNGKDAADD